MAWVYGLWIPCVCCATRSSLQAIFTSGPKFSSGLSVRVDARKKLANDEDFEPFYTIPTAATARDRLLLALKRDHPEHFAAVCALKLSPRAAAVQAGLIAAGTSRYGGACNIVAATALNEHAQGRLLCDLFQAMSPNAQCALIARAIEPRLGFGLAQRWRDEHRD